jgi:hypothetical protein
MAFAAAVERWRPAVVKYAADWPTDYLLAWIARESGGGASHGGWHTSLDERGVLQVHPATAKDLGFTAEEWSYLSLFPGEEGFELDKHFRISAKVLPYYRRLADQRLAANGVSWSGRDYYTFAKLLHGLPVIARDGLKAFAAAAGRAPSSWAEWAGWLRSTGWSYGAWNAGRISEILTNAESVGGFAPVSSGGGVLALAVLALVLL